MARRRLLHQTGFPLGIGASGWWRNSPTDSNLWRCLKCLVELDRKAVGIGKEGESLPSQFIDTNWFDGDPLGSEILYLGIEILDKKGDVSQPPGLGMCRT